MKSGRDSKRLQATRRYVRINTIFKKRIDERILYVLDYYYSKCQRRERVDRDTVAKRAGIWWEQANGTLLKIIPETRRRTE